MTIVQVGSIVSLVEFAFFNFILNHETKNKKMDRGKLLFIKDTNDRFTTITEKI